MVSVGCSCGAGQVAHQSFAAESCCGAWKWGWEQHLEKQTMSWKMLKGTVHLKWTTELVIILQVMIRGALKDQYAGSLQCRYSIQTYRTSPVNNCRHRWQRPGVSSQTLMCSLLGQRHHTGRDHVASVIDPCTLHVVISIIETVCVVWRMAATSTSEFPMMLQVSPGLQIQQS